MATTERWGIWNVPCSDVDTWQSGSGRARLGVARCGSRGEASLGQVGYVPVRQGSHGKVCLGRQGKARLINS
jgi:hypothetical protein